MRYKLFRLVKRYIQSDMHGWWIIYHLIYNLDFYNLSENILIVLIIPCATTTKNTSYDLKNTYMPFVNSDSYTRCCRGTRYSNKNRSTNVTSINRRSNLKQNTRNGLTNWRLHINLVQTQLYQWWSWFDWGKFDSGVVNPFLNEEQGDSMDVSRKGRFSIDAPCP